jgi:iron transport multicopper oxidase
LSDHRHSFTPRGIVALVFSCISGILGVAVVAWYGFAKVEQETYVQAQHRIDEATGVRTVPITAAPGESIGQGKSETVEEVTSASSGGVRR